MCHHPEYNAIEYIFGIIKKKIKESNISNYKSLVDCLDREFKRLNKNGFHKYFDHSLKNLEKGLKKK